MPLKFQSRLERAGRRNENVSARGRAPMKIFSLFVQEPSEIVLSFVLITCIFHFNTVGIDVIEILPKNWIFFNKFVSKQNSPNLNCLQSRWVFSDSSLTFLIIIFKSSLSQLNIQIMMIVATMIIISFIIFYSPKLDISYHVFFQMLMKRKNLDMHIMDVWILIQLMINDQKWEFDFSKKMKITNVTRNVSKKKIFSAFSSFQQVLLLYLNPMKRFL